MCGIAGFIGRIPQDSRILDRMLAVESHRGPDASGRWKDNETNISLGHRRLSILDLSEGGAQPMLDLSGNYIITYNGEIYNYVELRAELVSIGVSFRTESDTEVVLEAYKQWGDKCLSRFNGMFSFAIYDKNRRILFCARDRYGEKPFLFASKPNLFVFASEYKSLLQHPGLSLDYDEARLVQAAYNQSTGLDADRQTVFNDVKQLLPGEAIEVDVYTLKTHIWKYWSLECRDVTKTIKEEVVFDEFRELLIDAVRIRMRSDVAVGSCLSGGLDSSAIVCIVQKLLGGNAEYHTFTGRFPGTTADEWQWAEHVIEMTGVTNFSVAPTVDGFLDELPSFIWHNELPVGSSSQYAQWNVFRLAKEHGVTVLLDGQGADEMLGGYEQYFAKYISALRSVNDDRRLALELPEIRSRYPLALKSPAIGMRDKLPFRLRHALSNRFGMGTSMLYGLNIETAKVVAVEGALPDLPGFNPLTNALVQDTFGRFLTTLLRYGDRNSMAHSREVRLPFCDHRIAEFVLNLPPHLLMGEVQTKRLLRESMRGILPEAIRTRWRKQGFRPPQDLWFSSHRMLEVVRDVFDSDSFKQSSYWIAPWWQNALRRVEQGQAELGWTLWHPFMIEQWKQNFLTPLHQMRVAAGVK